MQSSRPSDLAQRIFGHTTACQRFETGSADFSNTDDSDESLSTPAKKLYIVKSHRLERKNKFVRALSKSWQLKLNWQSSGQENRANFRLSSREGDVHCEG